MSFSAVKAGEAFVELAVSGRQKFEASIKAAQERLSSFAKSAARISAAIAAAGAAAGAAGIAMGVSAAKAGDKLDKMAARTGVSVEALSQLGFAAEQSGSDLDTMGNALFRLRRRMANAATGGGPAKRAFDDLGLASIDTAATVDEQFTRVVEALSGVQDESLRAQYAFELFGDQAKSLLPLLNSGADGINALRNEADMLGRTMSTEQATAAAMFSDSLNRLKTQVSGLTQQVGLSLLPTMTAWVEDALVAVRVVSELGAELFGAAKDTDHLADAMGSASGPLDFFMDQVDRIAFAVKWLQSQLTGLVAWFAEVGRTFLHAFGADGDLKQLLETIRDDLNDLSDEQMREAHANLEGAATERIRSMIARERADLDAIRETAQRDFSMPFEDLTHAVEEAAKEFRAQGPLDALEKGTIDAARKSAQEQAQRDGMILSEAKKTNSNLQRLDRTVRESSVVIEVIG
jgi:hypothetical protein